MQLAQLYKSGFLTEKQAATLRLMERCSKSKKIKIINEKKEPIIIDV